METDTESIRESIIRAGYHVSVHRLGDYVELHAFRLDQVESVSDDVAVPSDLKIVRCEGDNDVAIHRAMVELAGMCGLNLRT